MSLAEMYNKLEQFAQTYHELELSMNDLGKTRLQKFKRWFGEINRRGGYGTKAFLLGVAGFAGSILRYALKPAPQYVVDEYRRFGNKGEAKNDPVYEEGIWQWAANSDLGQAIGNNR